MGKRKTVTEAQAEAKKLCEMRDSVRRFTAFGDDNHAAIDAQIDVLERNMDDDEIYDRYANNDHERKAALQARAWWDGDEDESPSKSWEPLVRK